ncbi:MAG: iron uptake porin [Thermosynechococcaceae cyanobacterium]
MSNPFGKKVLFGALGVSLLTGAPVLAAESNPVEALAGLSAEVEPLDATRATEVPGAVSSPALIAEAEPASVSELMGSQVDQSYTGDRSIHDLSDNSQGQVTSVSQLSDVRPTDWAFQALQSLVERYGCIAGYPNSTFRGNRSATRYEMAAALNACLDQISDRFASKADLDAVKALQDEFAAELATLRGRVDGLEARVATVESQQFSTTTKLVGEAIFGFSGLAGDVADGSGNRIEDTRLSLTQRARLTFLTSFTGQDRLFIRLQSQNRAINFDNVSDTPTTRLAFDTGNSNNGFTLDRIDYKFPIGKDFNVTVFGNAAFHHYYATTVNPYFEGNGGSKGAISWFGERNPIYRNGTVGVSAKGVGTTWTPGGGDLRFDVGYFANAAQSPVAFDVGNGSEDGGLFGGGYSALAQASYGFGKSQIALTYVRTYDPSGLVRSGAGTTFAGNPFGAGSSIITDSIGAEANFGIGDKFAVGGWVGYTFANQVNGGLARDNAQILNASINFALKDLGKEGAILGLIAGIPPYVVNNDNAARENPDLPIHLELNYQFPVSKNIVITPGVFYLFNPDGSSADDGIFVGAIRTTFTF